MIPAGFQVHEPRGPLERVFAASGAVHQTITEEAARSAERRVPGSAPDMRTLVLGSIWNDVPCVGDMPGEMRDGHWCAAPSEIAELQSVYARRLFGAGPPSDPSARIKWDSHFEPACAHWHAQRVPGDTTEATRRKCHAQAGAWFEQACAARSAFKIGHILHMIQDSYAAGHAVRSADGTILEFKDATSFGEMFVPGASLEGAMVRAEHERGDTMDAWRTCPHRDACIENCADAIIAFNARIDGLAASIMDVMRAAI